MSKNVKDDIVRMFKQGIAVEAISDATGVPRTGVIGTLMRRGVLEGAAVPATDEGEYEMRETRIKNQIRDIGPEVREAVLREYRAYLSMATLHRRYGVTRTEVWKILVAEGEPLRARPEVSLAAARERRREEVLSLFEMGVPEYSILSLCAISRVTLHRIVKGSVREKGDAELQDRNMHNAMSKICDKKKVAEAQRLIRNPKIQQLLLLKKEIEAEEPVLVLPPTLVRVPVAVRQRNRG